MGKALGEANLDSCLRHLFDDVCKTFRSSISIDVLVNNIIFLCLFGVVEQMLYAPLARSCISCRNMY